MKEINLKNNYGLIFGTIFIVVYSISYILLNSYTIDGQRYFSLFDDAMISMRYAENIANGYGPIWNTPGEAVEGFSNPLWVYIMSFVHLLPISKLNTSLVIQINGVLLSIFNLFFIQKIALLLTDKKVIINSSVLLTAMYLPLLNWNLQGMEVSLITLLLSVSVFLNLRFVKENRFSIWQLILPSILVLVRMDTILFLFGILLFFFIVDNQKFRKIFFYSIPILGVTIFLLFAWRDYYFAEWLPNTYYLKMTGYPFFDRIGKGLYAFSKLVIYMTPIVFLIPYYFYFKSREQSLLIILLLFSITSIYSIYVGGDSWEWWLPANRFISPVMPLFIIAVIFSFFELFSKYSFKPITNVVISIIFLAALNFNSWEYLKGELLLEKTFTEKDNRQQTELAVESKKILKENAVSAIAIAGTLPYFLERNCIDILGKNDKAIARMPVLDADSITFLNYNPGHMKWNYNYSIGKLEPDAVLQLWYNPEKAIPYLIDYVSYEIAGFDVFFRKDSKNINWDRLESYN